MRRALELAALGKGHVSPNPMVGAVLVHGEAIISEGWHHRYGDVHAEVDCLDKVPAHLRHLIPECTMYVTLEPCAHTGKQPPCAPRIVEEGIRKVVVCNDDPFEQVSGAGYRILETAGVALTRGILAGQGLWLNRRFFTAQKSRRPYVILKWAQTADGFIAPPTKERTTISNHYSHTIAHKWRTEEAAIAVGYNTALHDNPALTARFWDGQQPLRLFIDRELRLPKTNAFYDGAAETAIFNTLENRRDGSVSLVQYDAEEPLPAQVLAYLKNSGRTSVIIEGGAALLSSFIKDGLWDEARVFTAGNTFGAGVLSPVLTNSRAVFTASVADDVLTVFQSAHAFVAHPYSAGMEL